MVRGRFPDMPAREVVTRLIATARDAGPPGKDDQTGYGIVRPLNAIVDDVPADAPNPVYDEVDRIRGTRTGGGTASPGTAVAGRTVTSRKSDWPVMAAIAAAVAVLVVMGTLAIRRRRVRRFR